MRIPTSVVELVARCTENRSEYRAGHCTETQTRVDFVNLLFAALGWDMDNRAGLPEHIYTREGLAGLVNLQSVRGRQSPARSRGALRS